MSASEPVGLEAMAGAHDGNGDGYGYGGGDGDGKYEEEKTQQ